MLGLVLAAVLNVTAVECDAPTVTLPARAIEISEGTELTLSAIATGREPLNFVWYDGPDYLGITNPIFVELPRGVHRVRVKVWDRCGTAESEELKVTVTPRPRPKRQ